MAELGQRGLLFAVLLPPVEGCGRFMLRTVVSMLLSEGESKRNRHTPAGFVSCFISHFCMFEFVLKG